MTIIGRGDLSPPRRHRHGRRRWPRVLLVLVVLAALGAGGYYGWRHWRGSGSVTVRTQATPCPVTTTTTPTPPTDGAAGPPVRVFNGSLRPGLARRVAVELHRRFGVRIGRVGNAAGFVHGTSVVAYPPRLAAEAAHVAAAVVPAPRLRLEPALRLVELDLGARFTGVADDAVYRAELARRLGPGPSSSPTAGPTSAGSPCR